MDFVRRKQFVGCPRQFGNDFYPRFRGRDRKSGLNLLKKILASTLGVFKTDNLAS